MNAKQPIKNKQHSWIVLGIFVVSLSSVLMGGYACISPVMSIFRPGWDKVNDSDSSRFSGYKKLEAEMQNKPAIQEFIETEKHGRLPDYIRIDDSTALGYLANGKIYTFSTYGPSPKAQDGTCYRDYPDLPDGIRKEFERAILPEKRLALVIGNAKYDEKIGKLDNPVRDAQDIAQALQELGFEVLRYENRSQQAMSQAINEFGARLKTYDMGLFYYSGHGFQISGENYLVPVDAHLTRPEQIPSLCVPVRMVMESMKSAGNLRNIVILDACRDNPFALKLPQKGLARMENLPTNLLIAYATAAGSAASDDHVYTKALLQYLSIPDMEIKDVFQHVRDTVGDMTNDQQIPWYETSIPEDVYLYQHTECQ
jgi:hypothetical protein